MLSNIRVLDHGYIRLIDKWGSDERIIESARMSTQKGFEGWGPNCPNAKTRDEIVGHDLVGTSDSSGRVRCVVCGDVKPAAGDEKLLAYLWKNRHETPFEMAGATFEVQAPIFVFREWHRHRVPFGYNEASARYAPLPDLNYVPTVERVMMGGGHLTRQASSVDGAQALTPDVAAAFTMNLEWFYKKAEELYQRALRDGVPKELARLCLPVGRYSKMRATGNLRGWLNLLNLRLPETAQWEFRQYSRVLFSHFVDLFPRTMSLFRTDFEAKHGPIGV